MSSSGRQFDFSQLRDTPHRRLNPLTGEWVLVSPQRTERPWQGQVERPENHASPTYDPNCYLCPGNERAGGVHNPDYKGTFVFDNDFATLRPEVNETQFNDGRQILVAETESGICRVVCFSPRHDLTLARMSIAEIRGVVDTWAEEFRRRGEPADINYVQIFENRGALMGCSNPHPHGQIWASSTIPNEPEKEHNSLLTYAATHGVCLLCEYLKLEQRSGERVVCENEFFLVVVPFWAVWPFEVLLLSKRHFADITLLELQERSALADILKRITTRYDNLFQVSFPYSMGFHQRPTDGTAHDECHLHAHFHPPLLRSSTVRKFMVGYELLAMPQRDLTAETAAARLRELPEQHYLGERKS